MTEQVDLTTPAASVKIASLMLDWRNKIISIGYVTDIGSVAYHTISETEAETLMILLNKANLTTNSLHRRTMQKLIADGVVAGTISGTPD